MTKLSYRALSKPSFIALQKKVFPVYFRLQTMLLIGTIITYPPGSLLSLLRMRVDLGIFAIASTTALLNWAKYGPATRTTMIDRYERLGGANNENETVNEERRAASRAFSRNHAMSIHLNLLSFGAIVLYGVRLGARVKI